MPLTTEREPLEAARTLGPLIREHSDVGERERRPAAATMDALREAGLFRLYTPRSLGGSEVDPVTCARVIEEVSGSDSAAGWAVMVANGVDWWCARLPDDGAEEIYARGPDAIIASAFNPPMQAIQSDGGYRVTESNPLASNIGDASWLFVPALVRNEDTPRMGNSAPEVVGTILAASECEIVDTWHALGMRGTDSRDVAVSDVFVPASRTFAIVPEFQPGSHYRGPLYRMPAMGAVVAAWAGVALAIARRSINELVALAEGKTPFASTTSLRERASAQAKVGQAEALLRSARLLLYDELERAWDRTLAEASFSLEDKAHLLMAAVHAMNSSARVVELKFSAAGTTAIYTRSPLERCFRDIQVLKQHGFFSESRYETVGQIHLGLPPDLGFVAF
jgi:alkylation response protein AidB-like acyl-CoA dehydrogenase